MPTHTILNRRTGTVTGGAPVRLKSIHRQRSGIELHNSSTSAPLWVAAVPASAASPDLAAGNRDFLIGPGQTLLAGYGPEVDVILQSASASLTYVLKEVG
ncbi:MAG: hypothetical protein MH204_08510 [Fimbriimonadaceae bacterium]|nr:hypothetical protein [Fimbriimonadaceae bacterium]